MTSNTLRIIQVVNVRWFNATAWYALTLSRILREAGHSVLVLGLPGSDSFEKAEAWGLDPRPLDCNVKNPLALAGLARRIRGVVREFRPHVVNCHRGEGFFLWAWTREAARRYTPFALVRTRGDQRPPKTNGPNKYLHRNADALIATNSRIAGAFKDLLGVPEGRVRTIPGGVDTGAFFPDATGRDAVRALWGVQPHERVFGLLGRFDPVKGQKETLEAFAALRGLEMKDIRLVLAGFSSCTSREEVEAWVDGHGLRDSVTLTDRLPDVRAAINAFDCGLVASTGSEAIARAALEIMACGVPLLGTDVGVMPDLLSPEALIRAGDVSAMAASMARFLAEDGFGAALRAEQAERMATLDGPHFLEQTLEAYEAARWNAANR